jgi:hypothetical protein
MRFVLILIVAALTLGSPTGAWAKDSSRSYPKSKQKQFGVPQKPLAESQAEAAAEAVAPSTRKPLVLTAELAGRAGIYSANLDFSVHQQISLGLGASHLSIGGSSMTAFPFYMNYYPTGESHRLLLTGGITIFALSMKSDPNVTGHEVFGVRISPSGSVVLPVASFGVGYELRAKSGFVLRALPYLMAIDNRVAPYFGISVGAWI